MIILYIDPGTGSMLFTILIGITAAVFFSLQKLWIKFKLLLTGGRIKKNNDKIPYLIFSDHKRYWNVFKPICDEFEKRKVPLEYWTASPDDPALDAKYEYIKSTFIGEGNKAFAKLNLMNVGICLSTTPGLDVYQWKRSKNTDWYVHIYHAVDDGSLYRMFGLDFYDAVLTSGGHQEKVVRELERLRGIPSKEVVMVGSAYMDALYERRMAENNEKGSARSILLAPSWGNSSSLNRFGHELIDALRSTGYRIIIRPHPQSFISEKKMIESLQRHYADCQEIVWNRDNDNFNVLNEADLLISDYSGVVYDYTLVFDKPLIYVDVPMDLSPYDAAWLEGPIWRDEVLPRLGIKLKREDFSIINEVIDNLLNDEGFEHGRAEVRKEIWVNKGACAKCTADYMIDKWEGNLKEKQRGQ